tara:strand:- start:3442 stop:3684 length:243 start_codon:yes stop_codon:yes gene_type:complete
VKFTDIGDGDSVFPGEYILHSPTNSVVLVGAFNKDKNFIRVFKDGKLFEDSVNSFKKILVDRKESKLYNKKGCGSCKGGR